MGRNKEVRYRRERNQKKDRLQRALVYLGESCMVCGVTENLQFDHIDSTTKLFNISQGTQYSEEKFWLEVNKCQLLCILHHKQKTVAEGSYSLLGEKHPNSKLRKLDIKYIRCLSELGHSARSIAKEFKVSDRTIGSILQGKTWGHVR